MEPKTNMFDNCTIKYEKMDGENTTISVTSTPDDNGTIKKLSVPMNEENSDYLEILAWVAEGNTIEPADE